MDPQSWSTKALPGSGDDVQINVAGSQTIDYSGGGTTVHSRMALA
jgi:hypothetical protein